ncbi:MAG: transglutaminaseTgpA domain-containing protein, partial [Planctomycetota bacterium]
ALRLAIVSLVLTNLGFVYVTGAVSWIWLGPLLVLTLTCPLLLPLTRYLVYRVAWNGAVLAIFGVGVHHATSSGVHHLLEDGLLLAALCQVHLLNNISHRQKPDLLFFNSFLIAVVTSFLSLDLGYLVVFVVYAPLLVVAMQLLALSRAGVEASPRLLRRTAAQGLWRGAVVLAFTFAVFLFLPRDFHRRGLIGERLRLRSPGGLTEVDFSEEVSLDGVGEVSASDRVVMKVRLLRGSRHDVPGHWRGATLDRFDGQQWQPIRGAWVPKGGFWRRVARGVWTRGEVSGGARVAVTLADRSAARLFMPLETRRMALGGAGGAWVQPIDDLTFRRSRSGRDRYTLEIDRRRRAPGGRVGTLPGRQAFRHLWLWPGTVPPAARSLAADLRRSVAPDAPQHEVVEEMRRSLSARYRYLAPGEPGSPRNLQHFLEGGTGGHCEYFATALAVMLRRVGVPCRLVTGYYSQEWDRDGTTLTIRARHAHAWVEVLDPEAGWYTADATPVSTLRWDAPGDGLFDRLQGLVSGLWNNLTGFDETARAGAVAW